MPTPIGSDNDGSPDVAAPVAAPLSLVDFVNKGINLDRAFGIGWRIGFRDSTDPLLHDDHLPISYARIVADVTAKQAIVDEAAKYVPGQRGYGMSQVALKALACAYDYLPGFDPAWRHW